MIRRMYAVARWSLTPVTLFGVLWSAACNGGDARPPAGRVHFPTAVALSTPVDGQHRYLYVGNSNFDLTYSRGSVQTYDLEVLNRALDAKNCGSTDVDRCGVLPAQDGRSDLRGLSIERVEGLVVSEVHTPSYVAAMRVIPGSRPGYPDRLIAPFRGDAALHYIDVDPSGHLLCAASPSEGGAVECTDDFRAGQAVSSVRTSLVPPLDPVAFAVGPLRDLVATGTSDLPGSYAILAHRGGAASLYFEEPSGDSLRPGIVHVLDRLPSDLSSVAVDPVTKLAWMTSSVQPILSKVGVAFDGTFGESDRSLLVDTGRVQVRDLDTGGPYGDIRDMQFDPRVETRRGYFLSRLPNALVIFDADAASTSLGIPPMNSITLSAGPSKLRMGLFTVGEATHLLGFVSCFESGELYVINLDSRELLATVTGLGGPYDMAVDTGRGRVYLTDFRQSVLRVLDLRETTLRCAAQPETSGPRPTCAPRQIGVVGRPTTQREL